MKKIKMPPIDYKALAEDQAAAKLERKGIATGKFTPSRTVDPAQPKETREARLKAGLDRVHFAAALGVSRKTVEAWENGARNPDGLATKVIRRILHRPAFIKELAQTR
jgi:putative transcriptional regulator